MSSVYRNQLSLLTQKMQAIPNNNIMEFNTYVKSLVKLLAAGGERCEDLAWNLLRAYKETGDERFTLYFQTKEDHPSKTLGRLHLLKLLIIIDAHLYLENLLLRVQQR
jgi:hypothetical protein